jgi:hypothetical protein
LVLVAAQFRTHDYSGGPDFLAVATGFDDEFETGAGGLLRVRFPDDFAVDERYAFDWEQLMREADPFVRFDYKRPAP